MAVFPRDVLSLNVGHKSGRYDFRNDCMEVNVKFNADNIKYVQFSAHVARRHLYGTYVMHLIEACCSPENRTRLLFDATRNFTDVNRPIKANNVKWNNTITINKSNMHHVFNAFLSRVYISLK